MFPQTHRTSASVCDLLGLFLFCTPLHTYLPSLPSSVKFISGKKPAPRQKQHSSYVLPLFLEKTVIIITGLYVCNHFLGSPLLEEVKLQSLHLCIVRSGNLVRFELWFFFKTLGKLVLDLD